MSTNAKHHFLSYLAAACLSLGVLAAPSVAHAQSVDVAATQTWDVLEIADGSIYKGVIVEQTPGATYKLAMLDGSVRVFAADQIVKISKEPNPNWTAPTAAAPQGGPAWTGGAQQQRTGGGMPKAFAQSGMRFGLDAIVVFPTGDWGDKDEGGIVETSFAPSLRFGYEAVMGNFGIGGGLHTRFVPWILIGDAADADISTWLLEAHAYGRASLHIGKVAPYAGMSMGVTTAQFSGPGSDDDLSETGFGLGIDFGLDAFVSNSIALGIGGTLNAVAPEFGDVVAPSYFGLRLGMTTTF
ncbi:MAG: hypothetical protein IPL79_12725 [Myxococcales bacterium]|nr:hypothetical protein [Myxococcales bacterium]